MTDPIDDKYDNTMSMGAATQERYNLLVSRAQRGTITDSERSELDQLRAQLAAKD